MANRRPSTISGRTRKLFKGELTAPDATKYTILLDTTQGLPNKFMAAPGKSAALPTPGSILGQALGRLYGFMVSCVTEDCTVQQYLLHADGSWALFAATTITAGADPQAFTWDPSAYGGEDALIVCLAGATAPDNIYATLIERTID